MKLKMVILNLEPFGYSPKAKILFYDQGWDYLESTWVDLDPKDTRNVEVLIIRLTKKIGLQELEFFPHLKYLVTATTGLDHVDLSCLNERNIKLYSLRGEDQFLKTIPSTAEHTWALLSSLVRNIPRSFEDVRRGNWNRDKFRGHQLTGKNIGIIGLGRVGVKVAEYAHAFNMQVGYYDPRVSNSSYKRFNQLEDLLACSDIITIHIHLGPQTTNLLNEQNIEHLKDGSYIINTSRGGIIDENALVESLKQGNIAGIGVDVLHDELNGIEQSPLWKAAQAGENVIITPHIGGATWEAMHACEEFLCRKLLQSI